MRTFPLRIGTPDGLLFEGEVQRIVCRSITGDLAILAGHCNFCTALGMGEAHVILEDGTSRSAACIGGMLTVMDGNCSLLATTWEWQEDIDVDRAGKAKERAQEKLAKGGLSDKEYNCHSGSTLTPCTTNRVAESPVHVDNVTILSVCLNSYSPISISDFDFIDSPYSTVSVPGPLINV